MLIELIIENKHSKQYATFQLQLTTSTGIIMNNKYKKFEDYSSKQLVRLLNQKSSPILKHFRVRAQSQDSILNILFPDQKMFPLQPVEPPIRIKDNIKWSMRKIYNIVEKQSSAVTNMTSRQISPQKTNRESYISQRDSCNSQRESYNSRRENIKIKKEIITNNEREKLQQFLSSSEILKVIKNKTLRLKSEIDEDLDEEIQNQQIQQIKHQFIRYQFKSNKDLSQHIHQQIPKVKQVIYSQAFSKKSQRKVSLDQNTMLTYKSKIFKLNPQLTKTFQRIVQQILYVIKFMMNHKIWFNYPLHYNKEFFSLIIGGDIASIYQLLDTEIHLIHNRNPIGQTPLHVAAICNNLAITKLLIKKGAHIEAQDARGVTPVLYALRSNSMDTFKFLLDCGAVPFTKTHHFNISNISFTMKQHLMRARLNYICQIWKQHTLQR